MDITTTRQVEDAIVRPVLLYPRLELDERIALLVEHFEMKKITQAMINNDATEDEIYQALEPYIGTSEIDDYIDETERQLDLILPE